MKNIINVVNLNLKKFIKGYFMLIALGVSFSFIASIIQSCNKDNYYEMDNSIDRTTEINNFKKTMMTANNNVINNSLMQRGISREEKAILYTEIIKPDALTLIKSYGITEKEIIAEFGSLDSEKVALTAEAIVKAEELIDNGQTLSIFTKDDYQLASLSFIGLNSTYAQSDTIGGCIADAIGITAAFELLQNGVAGLGRRGVLKLIRKIGGRALGPVGLALATYDFADCMGWI